jgi:hypothetical protein
VYSYESQPNFLTKISTPFSGIDNKPRRKPAERKGAKGALLRAGFLFGLLFNPEDGGDM